MLGRRRPESDERHGCWGFATERSMLRASRDRIDDCLPESPETMNKGTARLPGPFGHGMDDADACHRTFRATSASNAASAHRNGIDSISIDVLAKRTRVTDLSVRFLTNVEIPAALDSGVCAQ